MILFLLLLVGAFTGGSVFADTFHIWPDSSIQHAVDSATDGDTILIHEGLYQETVVVCAKRLIIGSEFLLDGDTTHISQTIIEPDSSRPDSHSCFIYARYATCDDGKLVGLRMRNGGGSLWEDAYPGASAGGAVFIRRANVAIERCRIENCRADFGGGIAVIGASIPYRADVLSTSITNCRGLFGGGIKAVFCSLYVVECYLGSDTGDTQTGGMDVMDSYAEIRNCIIRRCGGGLVGGMIYAGSSGSITGCLFEENGTVNDFNAQSHLLFGQSDAEISGCIFRHNTTSEWAVTLSADYHPLRFFGNLFEDNHRTDISGILKIADNSVGNFAYNIVRNNSGPNSGALWCQNFCRVRVHHNVFEGNTVLNPSRPSVLMAISFANPRVDSNIISGNNGQAIFYLDPITLDARYNYWGDASGPYHPTQNPEGRGDTLLQDSILFIPWLTEPPDTTMPSNVRERTHSEIASTWRLVGVYPNPFNSAVRIILAGFTRSDFRLTLHNLLGQEVAQVHSGALTGGELSYTAPPSLATGVYFLRASSRDFVETKKVLFMK